jgi:tripartite-type tricarboxylate transporter receptor subunit TctC
VAPAFADMMAGHVQMASASPVEVRPQLGSGKIRALGVSSKERSKQLPDVPTILETIASPTVATHNGLFAPKQTPQEIIDAIAEEVGAAVKTKKFSDKLLLVGFEPFGSTSAEMVATIAADKESWLPVKNDMMVATQ